MPNSRQIQIQNFLEDDPHNSFLNFAMALEFEKVGDYSNAIIYFEKLREMDPDYLGLYYPLAKNYRIVGQFTEALEIINKGIQIAHNHKNFKTEAELKALFEDLSDLD